MIYLLCAVLLVSLLSFKAIFLVAHFSEGREREREGERARERGKKIAHMKRETIRYCNYLLRQYFYTPDHGGGS